MRIWLMWEFHDCLKDMKQNRTHLVKSAWNNAGLFLSIDGSQDDNDERRVIAKNKEESCSDDVDDSSSSDDDEDDEKLNDE